MLTAGQLAQSSSFPFPLECLALNELPNNLLQLGIEVLSSTVTTFNYTLKV